MTAPLHRLASICLATGLLVGCAGKRSTATPEDAWWLLPDLGDEEGEDGEGDDDDDEGDDEDDYAPGANFWGEASVVDGTLEWGAVGFFIGGEDGGLVCEVEYTIASASEATDCSACSFAYTFEYGDQEFLEGDAEACDDMGWTDLTGSTVRVGGAGGTLWVDFGDGWQDGGASELDGQDWFFELPLEELLEE